MTVYYAGQTFHNLLNEWVRVAFVTHFTEHWLEEKNKYFHHGVEMTKDTMKQTSCMISLFFSSSLDSSLCNKNTQTENSGLLLLLFV